MNSANSAYLRVEMSCSFLSLPLVGWIGAATLALAAKGGHDGLELIPINPKLL